MREGEVYRGDVRDFARALAPRSIRLIVTSPPYYGLRDYDAPHRVWGGDPACDHEWDYVSKVVGGENHETGSSDNFTRRGDRPREYRSAFCGCGAWLGALGLEPTHHLYVDHIVEVMAALRPALTEDGSLWLNLGDSYANDRKWGGASGGKNARADGGLDPNRGNGRERQQTGLPEKSLIGIPWRVALAMVDRDRWTLRQENVWVKPNPTPESIRDRTTRATESFFHFTQSRFYYYDKEAIAEPVKEDSIRRLTQPTFDQQTGGAKDYGATGVNPNRSMRRILDNEGAKIAALGIERLADLNANWQANPALMRNRRNVWEIPPVPFPGAHFATFPPALVELPILAGSARGDLVCDPFMGSGTTAEVATVHGRRWIGCDEDARSPVWTAERLAALQRQLF